MTPDHEAEPQLLRLDRIMRRLRVDCPWDAEQTHRSLTKHLIEETAEVVDAIEQDDEWYSLGQLGQQITAANPDFDPRNYGKKKLSDLMADLKMFELRRGAGNQFEARRLD